MEAQLAKVSNGSAITTSSVSEHESLAFQTLTADQIIAQVNTIQEVMKKVMHEDEHYGVIKGCGDKPVLLQPGAQVLALTFGFAPEFDIDERRLEGGHREFIVTCRLLNRVNGSFVGMGIGAGSTRENKWLYTTGPTVITDIPVPKEYWDIRSTNPKRAQELLGGPGHITKKNDSGQWVIAKRGEKVETDNPDDKLNTVLKMSCKRAFVAAVLNTTAASDMFTQDIEEQLSHEDEIIEEAPQDWHDEVIPQIVALIQSSKLNDDKKAQNIAALQDINEDDARKLLFKYQKAAAKAEAAKK